MQETDFRERQVLADLERAAAAGASGMAGLDPEEAAVLLHDTIERRGNGEAVAALWARHADKLRRMPPPVRAALMNGVEHLLTHGLIPADCQPEAADLLTYPLPRLETALIALARTMSRTEIDHVARADYGNDVTRHRQALTALLADARVAYPGDDAWFPAEVVELVSHVPGQPGHVPSLAIVLLDALRSGDRHGNAQFRLENQFAEIARLLPNARDTLFAGFRHLYEANRAWSPSLPETFTLPWAEPA